MAEEFKMADLIVDLTVKDNSFNRSLDAVKSKIEGAKKDTKAFGGDVNEQFAKMGKAGSLLGGAYKAASFASEGLGESVLKLAGGMKGLAGPIGFAVTGFQALATSVLAAQSALDELRNEASLLTALGHDGAAATEEMKQLATTLRSETTLSLEQLYGVMLKAKQSGFGDEMEDITRQAIALGNAFGGGSANIARAMDLIKNARLDQGGDSLKNALDQLGGPKFFMTTMNNADALKKIRSEYGALVEVGKTQTSGFDAQLGRLNDAWDELISSFGRGLGIRLGPFIEIGTKAVQALADAIAANIPIFMRSFELATGLGKALGFAGLESAEQTLMSLGDTIGKVVTWAVDLTTTILSMLNVVLVPFAGIVRVVVSALGGLIESLVGGVEWTKTFSGLFDSASKGLETVQVAIAQVTAVLSFMVEGAVGAASQVGQAIGSFATTLIDLGRSVGQTIASLFSFGEAVGDFKEAGDEGFDEVGNWAEEVGVFFMTMDGHINILFLRFQMLGAGILDFAENGITNLGNLAVWFGSTFIGVMGKNLGLMIEVITSFTRLATTIFTGLFEYIATGGRKKFSLGEAFGKEVDRIKAKAGDIFADIKPPEFKFGDRVNGMREQIKAAQDELKVSESEARMKLRDAANAVKKAREENAKPPKKPDPDVSIIGGKAAFEDVGNIAKRFQMAASAQGGAQADPNKLIAAATQSTAKHLEKLVTIAEFGSRREDRKPFGMAPA